MSIYAIHRVEAEKIDDHCFGLTLSFLHGKEPGFYRVQLENGTFRETLFLSDRKKRDAAIRDFHTYLKKIAYHPKQILSSLETLFSIENLLSHEEISYIGNHYGFQEYHLDFQMLKDIKIKADLFRNEISELSLLSQKTVLKETMLVLNSETTILAEKIKAAIQKEEQKKETILCYA
jgi:hypothetical protein